MKKRTFHIIFIFVFLIVGYLFYAQALGTRALENFAGGQKLTKSEPIPHLQQYAPMPGSNQAKSTQKRVENIHTEKDVVFDSDTDDEETAEAPDLIVHFPGFAPSNPLVGQHMTFTAQVMNRGGSYTPPSVVYLSIDGSILGQYAVGILGNLKSEAMTWEDIWTATAGKHTYQICADTTNAVRELHERNNCLSGSFHVTQKKQASKKQTENTNTKGSVSTLRLFFKQIFPSVFYPMKAINYGGDALKVNTLR